jgi:hypothetical protein
MATPTARHDSCSLATLIHPDAHHPQNHMAAYPYKVTPELRRELRFAKAKLSEILAVCDPPPPPEVICKVLRAWRNITPAQKAAWEEAAARENMRTAADPFQN